MIEFCFLGINDSCQELGGGNTSLLVKDGESCVAVDVSCNLAAMVEAEPEVIVLTHEHIDHVYGLPSFLHQSMQRGRKKPLEIIVPPGMEYMPSGMMDLFHLKEKNGMFDITLKTDSRFWAGSLWVKSFVTDHLIASIGIIIEEGGKRLVFTSDTRPDPVLPKADVLIHEASGISADEAILIQKGHSSGADAGRAAKEAGVKQLYLCHLPAGRKEKVLEDAQTYFPKAQIPEILKWYKV